MHFIVVDTRKQAVDLNALVNARLKKLEECQLLDAFDHAHLLDGKLLSELLLELHGVLLDLKASCLYWRGRGVNR